MNCQVDLEFMKNIIEMSVKLNPKTKTEEVEDFLNLFERTVENKEYDILLNNSSHAHVDVLTSSIDNKRKVLSNKIIYNKNTKECTKLGGRVKCWFCSSYIGVEDKRWILPSSKIYENDNEIIFTGEGAFCTWVCVANYAKDLTTRNKNITISMKELDRNLELLYKYYAGLIYDPYPSNLLNKYERTDFEEYGGKVSIINYISKSLDLEE